LTDPAGSIDSPLMSLLEARERLLFIVVVVGISVFLFACGGSGTMEEQPAEASLAMPAPQPAPQPVPPPADPVGEPASPTPADEESAAVEVVPEPEDDAAPAAVEQPGDGEREPAPRLEPVAPGTHVFTNKDLGRYAKVKEEFGLRDDVVTVDLTRARAKEEPEATADRAGPALTAAERDREIAAARAEVTRLSQEVTYLEGRIPSLHNPFLPRPRLSEADQSAESGMDNAERLNRVNERLGRAQSELAAARARLAELYNAPAADRPAGDDRD